LTRVAAPRRWAACGVVLALVAGVALRLVWPADMEYKADEIYSFDRTQRVGVDESWPWVGMNNSADVPHPGMSVWIFLALAKLSAAASPVELNVACMALNALALCLFAFFIRSAVPAAERELWWWGCALLCVNPLAVLFERKIWPPSALPIVGVCLLAAWWHRSRPSWALAFGLLAAAAAQIHPGAAFFAAGLAIWALVFDRGSLRWGWSLAGAALGSLTAWPWVHHLLFVAERSAAGPARWWRIFEFKFWIYWFTQPFGFSLHYSLGDDFPAFLRGPVIGGRDSYLVAGLHIALGLVMAVVLTRWLLRARRQGLGDLTRTPTGLAIGAVGVGYGVLLTITGLPVYRHYLIVAAPVMCVAFARVTWLAFDPPQARKVFGGLCLAQACLTWLFLSFVHRADGPIRGDYGTPYRAQVEQGGRRN
jgi:hypothetical protein